MPTRILRIYKNPVLQEDLEDVEVIAGCCQVDAIIAEPIDILPV